LYGGAGGTSGWNNGTVPAGGNGAQGIIVITNGTASLPTCGASQAGLIEYSADASTLMYCNGTHWYSMKGVSNGSCVGTTAGGVHYTSNIYEFCDGTTWWEFPTNTP